MALSEFEERRIHKVVGDFLTSRRPPPHLRDELDLFVDVHGQSAIIQMRRRIEDGQYIEQPVAKATWVKSQQRWKIFWYRASGYWQNYEPQPEASTLGEFCRVVDEDQLGCFWD